jgi:hypothetical protein
LRAHVSAWQNVILDGANAKNARKDLTRRCGIRKDASEIAGALRRQQVIP